jgi:hypothetical protein
LVVRRPSAFSPSSSSLSEYSLPLSELLLDFELSEKPFLIGFGLSFPFFSFSGSAGSPNSFGS